MIKNKVVQINQLIQKAQTAQFLVQKESEPTCFKYTSEDGTNLKVSIGCALNCSCNKFKTHCIHTIHALIKIFKVNVSSPLLHQVTYSESDIKTILNGRPQSQTKQRQMETKPNIDLDQLCAICYDPLGFESLVSCQNQCQAIFHTKCIYDWGKQRQNQQQQINCPCCRIMWTQTQWRNVLIQFRQYQIAQITHEQHCTTCKSGIVGRIYKCASCINTYLCQRCYIQNKQHIKNHLFYQFKDSITDSWIINVEKEQLWDCIIDQIQTYPTNINTRRILNCSYCREKLYCKQLKCGHLICEGCFLDSLGTGCICPIEFAPIFPGHLNTVAQNLIDNFKQLLNPELYELEKAQQLPQQQQIKKLNHNIILSPINFKGDKSQRSVSNKTSIKAQGFRNVKKAHVKQDVQQ